MIGLTALLVILWLSLGWLVVFLLSTHNNLLWHNDCHYRDNVRSIGPKKDESNGFSTSLIDQERVFFAFKI